MRDYDPVDRWIDICLVIDLAVERWCASRDHRRCAVMLPREIPGAMDAIDQRMLSGEPFTFKDIYLRDKHLRENSYSIISYKIRRLRENGLIAYQRRGRTGIWAATDEGRAFLAAFLGESDR